MTQIPKPGDKLSTWTGNPEDSKRFLISVVPYTGHYPDMFKYVVRYTALSTKLGYMECAISGEAAGRTRVRCCE